MDIEIICCTYLRIFLTTVPWLSRLYSQTKIPFFSGLGWLIWHARSNSSTCLLDHITVCIVYSGNWKEKRGYVAPEPVH